MSRMTKAIIGAIIPFALVAAYIIATQEPSMRTVDVLDIGIEHTKSMTLDIMITKNDTVRGIDISNDAVEKIAVSVPDTWKRGEVRNVPLKNVTADDPSFGYVRWTLPAKASVSYRTTHPFDHLNIHNPSNVPLKIRLTIVDLQKNTGDHQVYLVKEGAVKIP